MAGNTVDAAEVLPLADFGMQICKGCKRKLPFADFYPNREMRLGRVKSCKKCVRERLYDLRDANPQTYLDAHLRRKFGITLNEYDVLLEAQGGVCAICGEPPETRRNKRRRRQGVQQIPRLVVDHDHISGKVRGLLCSACNRGIGFLKEDPATIRAALAYLELK